MGRRMPLRRRSRGELSRRLMEHFMSFRRALRRKSGPCLGCAHQGYTCGLHCHSPTHCTGRKEEVPTESTKGIIVVFSLVALAAPTRGMPEASTATTQATAPERREV